MTVEPAVMTALGLYLTSEFGLLSFLVYYDPGGLEEKYCDEHISNTDANTITTG